MKGPKPTLKKKRNDLFSIHLGYWSLAITDVKL